MYGARLLESFFNNSVGITSNRDDFAAILENSRSTSLCTTGRKHVIHACGTFRTHGKVGLNWLARTDVCSLMFLTLSANESDRDCVHPSPMCTVGCAGCSRPSTYCHSCRRLVPHSELVPARCWAWLACISLVARWQATRYSVRSTADPVAAYLRSLQHLNLLAFVASGVSGICKFASLNPHMV